MVSPCSDSLSPIPILFALQDPSQKPQKSNTKLLFFSDCLEQHLFFLIFIFKAFTLCYADEVRAVLTVVEEEDPDSYLLAPSPRGPGAPPRSTVGQPLPHSMAVSQACSLRGYLISSTGQQASGKRRLSLRYSLLLLQQPAQGRLSFLLPALATCPPHPPRGSFYVCACPKLATSEKLLIIPGAGTTSKGCPVLYSSSSSQIPSLRTDPSCWPTPQRGWCR